ncbi:MAG: hypothetical protein LHV69_02475, partial [Elusimicrobia bacterium]|nr:hypothetical protein [Candidatus Obscuribacterium magneticum]
AQFSAAGVYVLRITASDSQKISSDTVTVTVQTNPADNNSPNVEAGRDRAIVFPIQFVYLRGQATDDGMPVPPGMLTIEWTSIDQDHAFIIPPDQLNATGFFTDPGTYQLKLKADDGALSTEDSLLVRVYPAGTINQAPQIEAGADQTITLPVNSVSLDAAVTDDGLPDPPGVYTTQWEKVSGPEAVTFGDASQVDTTAQFSEAGVYVLKLTANDSDKSAFDTVQITVRSNPADNQAPQVSVVADQTVITLPLNHANLDGTVTDDGLPMPPGMVTTTWTQVGGPAGQVSFANASSQDTTATFTAPGAYTLRLTAFDGALTRQADVAITVNSNPADNQAPQVEAGIDQTITLPIDTVNLDATVTDDGLPTPGVVTTLWEKLTGPGTVTFGNASQVNTSAQFSAAGVYVLCLTANDTQKTSSDTVKITINSNPADTQPPQVSIVFSPTTLTLPQNQVNLDGTVVDDGLPIPPGKVTTMWTQVGGPAGQSSFADASSEDTTATFAAPGIFTLRLTVFDGALSGQAEVTITVNSNPAANLPPTVEAGAEQIIILPVNFVILQGVVRDDDLPNPPARVTSTWSKSSGPGRVEFADPTQPETMANFSEAGIYILRLTADDTDKTAYDDVIIKVKSNATENLAPSVDAGENQTIVLPLNYIDLNGSVVDDGLPNPPAIVSVQWTMEIGPAPVRFANTQAEDTRVEFPQSGVYVLRLTASDSDKTGSDWVVILVKESLPQNMPPFIFAGADQTIRHPQNTIQLEGVVYDDGLPDPPKQVTLTWSMESGPAPVTFSNSFILDPTVTFTAAGTYTLKVVANDGELPSEDTLVVTVQDQEVQNQKPWVNAGADRFVIWPNPVELNGMAIDDEKPSRRLDINWTQAEGPGTALFDADTSLHTQVHFDRTGEYRLVLTANDGELASTDELIVIAYRMPSVYAGEDQRTRLTQVVQLEGKVREESLPSALATYDVEWTMESGPAQVTFTNTQSARTEAQFNAPGSYVLRFEASEGLAKSADTVIITVEADAAGANGLLKTIFNPNQETIDIFFNMEQAGVVEGKIFDIQGEFIRDLIVDNRAAGEQTVTWDGKNDQGNIISSGIYVVIFKKEYTGGEPRDIDTEIKKVAAVK